MTCRVLAVLLFSLALLSAQSSPEAAVRALLAEQAAAWNRGDLDTFLASYKDSPETLFIGKTISRGLAAIRERYQKNYPRERMGKLTFSDIEVRPLGPNYASVVGRFKLERAASAGGEAQGIYSLLLHHTTNGWKIIQDHTS